MEKLDLRDEEFKKAFLKALPPEKYLKMKNFKYLTDDTKYLLVLLKVLDKLDEAMECDDQKPFNRRNKKSNLDIMCCMKTTPRNTCKGSPDRKHVERSPRGDNQVEQFPRDDNHMERRPRSEHHDRPRSKHRSRGDRRAKRLEPHSPPDYEDIPSTPRNLDTEPGSPYDDTCSCKKRGDCTKEQRDACVSNNDLPFYIIPKERDRKEEGQPGTIQNTGFYEDNYQGEPQNVESNLQRHPNQNQQMPEIEEESYSQTQAKETDEDEVQTTRKIRVEVSTHSVLEEEETRPKSRKAPRCKRVVLPRVSEGCFKKIELNEDSKLNSPHLLCQPKKKKKKKKKDASCKNSSDGGSRKKRKPCKSKGSSTNSQSSGKHLTEGSSYNCSDAEKPKKCAKEAFKKCKTSCKDQYGSFKKKVKAHRKAMKKASKTGTSCYSVKKGPENSGEYDFIKSKRGSPRTGSFYELDLKCIKKAYKKEHKLCKTEVKERKKCEKLEKKKKKQLEKFMKQKQKMHCKLEKKYKGVLGEKYDQLIADDCRAVGVHYHEVSPMYRTSGQSSESTSSTE